MNSQQMMEEIDRLARLCEAKDTEIARLKAWQRDIRSVIDGYEQQLSESQAQIAMQAETLNAVFNATPPGTHYCSPDMQLVKEAITLTSETVAAWRAKETEPLRREVAMICKLHEDIGSGVVRAPDIYEALGAIINYDQAAALAYEREVKAKALEEAANNLEESEETPYLSMASTQLLRMAAELRAANKGEVK